MAAHDWPAMADCVAPEVVRVGPFGDTYRGRDDYVAFIAGLLPTLPGYVMDVARVIYADGGRTAMVELSETIDAPSGRLRTPEGLIFDLAEDGRIAHIAIYIQRLPDEEAQP